MSSKSRPSPKVIQPQRTPQQAPQENSRWSIRKNWWKVAGMAHIEAHIEGNGLHPCVHKNCNSEGLAERGHDHPCFIVGVAGYDNRGKLLMDVVQTSGCAQPYGAMEKSISLPIVACNTPYVSAEYALDQCMFIEGRPKKHSFLLANHIYRIPYDMLNGWRMSEEKLTKKSFARLCGILEIPCELYNKEVPLDNSYISCRGKLEPESAKIIWEVIEEMKNAKNCSVMTCTSGSDPSGIWAAWEEAGVPGKKGSSYGKYRKTETNQPSQKTKIPSTKSQAKNLSPKTKAKSPRHQLAQPRCKPEITPMGVFQVSQTPTPWTRPFYQQLDNFKRSTGNPPSRCLIQNWRSCPSVTEISI